ncbi:hypothetical protein ACSBR1_040584 [Camellia fascicularis]
MEVKIESNSEMAINQIQNGASHSSPYKALIEHAKFLLSRCKSTLEHTLRKGNKCVDKLANLGVDQDEHVILDDPSASVRSPLIVDMIGVRFERD